MQQIHACSPPPQPSPASGGGSTPSPRRHECATRPRRRRHATPIILIHLSNSPSQRSACPLKVRARAPRLFLSLLPKRGAERREGAKLGRACEARPCPRRWRRGAPLARCARLSALHRGAFSPHGPRFLNRRVRRPIQRAARGRVVVPGGRHPGPPEPAACETAAAGRHSPLRLRIASRNARHRAGMIRIYT
jgi:hypothetical protein